MLANCTATTPDLPLGAAASCGPYNRAAFNHWIDEDHDGIPTNHEILIAESEIPVSTNRNGTRVLSGRWVCPYTGEVFTKLSEQYKGTDGKTHTRVLVDCDHVVSLGEAWRWGACRWSPEKRQEYANYTADSFHLVCVKAAANRAKADRGVADGWLPATGKCEYLAARIAVWRNPRWAFSVPKAEVDATLDAVAKYCPPKY